jgi:hypothetical protein
VLVGADATPNFGRSLHAPAAGFQALPDTGFRAFDKRRATVTPPKPFDAWRAGQDETANTYVIAIAV